MIRVTFSPRDGHKLLRGRVEVDGLDISRYVTGLQFSRAQDGETTLHLDLALYGESVVDLTIPDDALDITARVYGPDRAVEVTAVKDAAKAYALAGKS